MVVFFSAYNHCFGFVPIYTESSAGYFVRKDVEVVLQSFAVFAKRVTLSAYASVFSPVEVSSRVWYGLSISPCLAPCDVLNSSELLIPVSSTFFY